MRSAVGWRTLAILLPLATFAALSLAACGGGGEEPTLTAPPAATATPAPDAPESFMGVGVTPPIPKPDFVLTDTDGQPFDIRAETEGYVTLIYVGYTNCPDICPTHLNNLAKVLKEVPPDVAAKVKVLFITADPERDTPEVLKSYLSLFDESFIGLTGDRETIDRLQRSLGIPVAGRQDLGNGEYAVSHAAFVMAYGPDDLAHIVFPSGLGTDAIRNDITKLAREGWEEPAS